MSARDADSQSSDSEVIFVDLDDIGKPTFQEDVKLHAKVQELETNLKQMKQTHSEQIDEMKEKLELEVNSKLSDDYFSPATDGLRSERDKLVLNLSQQKEQNKQLELTNQELTKKVNSMIEDHKTVIVQLKSDFKKELAGLVNEVEQLRTETVNAEDAERELELLRGTHRAEMRQMQVKIDEQKVASRQELDLLRKGHTEENSRMQVEIEKQMVEVKRLAEENNENEQVLTSRTARINELSSEVETLVKQKLVLEQELSRRGIKITDLELEVANLRQAISEAENSLRAREVKEQELVKTNELHHQAKEQIEQELVNCETVISGLRSELQVSHTSCEQLQTSVLTLENNGENLKATLNELKQGRLVVKIFFTYDSDAFSPELLVNLSGRKVLISTKQSVGVLKQQLREALSAQGFSSIKRISTVSEDHRIHHLDLRSDSRTVKELGLTESANVLVLLGESSVAKGRHSSKSSTLSPERATGSSRGSSKLLNCPRRSEDNIMDSRHPEPVSCCLIS